ncbi:hypothetical protein ACE5IS_00650 [Leptospira wolffii]|uniref:Uncharacterized protein n=1 Tax=Leptospira wolffii TaxID=409998 RepID=A0ABV5BJ85_9LEPT|nr:hypothetical protein [Leptospira wolffii]EPG65187.1 hypothetical protein LEP1GSC061_3327 [Leptospira wolffii serovar Khorat str. Khorat-H2]TGK62284.1 hypothetical protein EHQ32_05520 [Leptospira wolffii]TGK68199.1 hypothetical protein EHQ27_14680 [Leptospira wolffii]TGK74332.1 hypothetical protein EHQ35_08255 [Leptospira wolffii]TGL32093.1 hypothetical protein EHQ57_04420 [Leptospira wolffii]
MPLSDQEIKSLVEKLRSEYRDGAKQSPKLFDGKGFEDRYIQTLKHRGNIESFLKEEVSFLEKVKAKHQELVEKRNAAKGETINRILDEQEEKLSKYQRVDFHPLARTEMRFFYGAMTNFADTELPVLIHIFRGTPEYSSFQDSISVIERIGVTKRGMPSLRIAEHIKALLDANGNQSSMERDSQNILKEVCIALAALRKTIQECIEKNRVSDRMTVQVNDRDYPKAAEAYRNLLFGIALEKIIVKTESIIRDFRMSELVGLDAK